MSQSVDRCELCRRKAELTRHHLIPRTVHRRKRIRRIYSRAEMLGNILWVCRGCHSKIHATFSEMELALHYHNRERLLGDAKIQRFTSWLASKPDGFRPGKAMARKG